MEVKKRLIISDSTVVKLRLYQGDHDNMITSITTVASPHNGTYAADLLGNEALIRQFVYDYSKFQEINIQILTLD